MATITRRVFLGWASFLSAGILAHHKPSHRRGPAPTTTTTTTLPPSGGYSSIYRTLY